MNPIVTQRDIAKELGISISLVSRALAGKAGEIGAAPDTVRKINEAAERLGYRPNPAARALRGVSSRTLGILVYDFSDPYFGYLLGELQRLASQREYVLLVAGLPAGRGVVGDLGVLARRRLDGVLLLGGSGDGHWRSQLEQITRRIFQIGVCTDPRNPGGGVALDDRQAIGLLIDHMKERGHTEIGFVGSSAVAHHNRYQLLEESLQARGLAYNPSRCVMSSSPINEAGYAAGKYLLRRISKIPSALLASSDMIALGLLRVLAERGIDVPRDVAVASIDDIPIAAMVRPPLTTVRQPITEMAELALDRLTGPESRLHERILVPGRLIVRGSSGVMDGAK